MHEHQLAFGDFRLKQNGKTWKATVAGEPLREALLRGFDIKSAKTSDITINKAEHIWEARCLLAL